ncbi:MAG: hypothetical protein O3A95_01650 [Planctomycetota bacterium]|nr:hypothetical protein [Planctomycetota bacterium]MDA1112990.1 hypothetical protein [Planctomycetota bacterium]
MAAKRNNLLAEISRFERRLRDAWSMEVPCTPKHLQSYRQAWLDTLAQPNKEATLEEMHRAIRRSNLTLVSDFHPLRRSRTGLAELIRQLPDDKAIVLGLELLPRGITLTVGEALRAKDLRLITGQSLQEAYAPVLQALSQRRATLVGTWVDGNVHRRDEAAAKVWARINRKPGQFRGIFHFGDWHLAAGHLPLRMQEIGESPTIIHQSPEPIWERAGLMPSCNVFRMNAQHWAWLQTPPLGLWANHLQDLSNHDEESAVEAAEHLCESASEFLAETLGLGPPSCRLTVAPKQTWDQFHAQLPRHLQATFALDAPPKIPIFHPRLPLMWSPGPLDLTHLIEGAAHCLNSSSPLHLEVGLRPELRRQAFRSLCAFLVNPFLAGTSIEALAKQLFPQVELESTVAKVDQIWQSPESWHSLNNREEALLLAFLSRRLGQEMAAQKELKLNSLQQFLEPGTQGFDWDALMAIILAA